MGVTAFAIGNANIINLAWDDAFGFNNVGSQYRFKFTGNKLELDISDPFLAGGDAGCLVYIDGVAQPRLTVTNSADYQDGWTGSEGTHECWIIDDYGRVGSQKYSKWIQNIRITSAATESLSLPTDIIARKMMAPSSAFDSTVFQLEGPPLAALDTNLFGFDRTGISMRLKIKSAKMGALVYSATADNTLYCRLYVKVGSDYVAGAVQSVALPIAGFNYVMLFTGLDDVTEHEAIFEAINSTSLLTNGTAVGIWGFTTSSGTGINAAHGYATYRDEAFVFFTDSLGDSADANTGTGEPGGFDYWPSQVCNRNGAICINFASNGARTDGIAAFVAAKMASIPGGITVTKCFTTSGRNNRFSSWTPTQTHDAYVDLMTNIVANVSITCQINVIYMFYTGNSANNATDDLHIAAEQTAVAGFLPDSRIVEWDPRTWPLVQPDNFSGTAFTAHQTQSGNDIDADQLSPTGPSAPSAPVLGADDVEVAEGSIAVNPEAPASDGGDAIIAYEIWRKVGAGSYALLTTILAANLGDGYHDATTTAGNTVDYKVKCYNDIGYSGFSAEREVTSQGPVPATPANLAVSADATGITVDFDVLGNHTFYSDLIYKIERSRNGTLWTHRASVADPTSTYKDTSTVVDGVYYYRITAISATYGTSPPTSEQHTTAQGPLLVEPAATKTRLSIGIGLGL